VSPGQRARTPRGAARAVGEKPAEVAQLRLRRDCSQPRPGVPTHLGLARSARRRHRRGCRLAARSSNGRRPGSALGRAGTQTSWGRSARGRTEARGAQHGRDRGRGDADPELQQLTLDAHIAPARILSGKPRDQAARRGRKGRTTKPARAASATSLQQCPVPAAKRRWTHRKAGPPLSREHPTGRSERGAVGGRVPRPLPSAPEDRELVTQHDDLKVPLTTASREEANNHGQEPVQHTHQHDAQSEASRPRSLA
jgi:hypothetical protein